MPGVTELVRDGAAAPDDQGSEGSEGSEGSPAGAAQSALFCQGARPGQGQPAPAPRELAMRIRQVLSDSALRTRLTTQARRDALDIFKPARLVEGYHQLYRAMLGAGKPNAECQMLNAK
jgi:hypothetical protein